MDTNFVLIIPIFIKIIYKNSYSNMEESSRVDYIFKFILVGDTSVGKSSLLSTFTKN